LRVIPVQPTEVIKSTEATSTSTEAIIAAPLGAPFRLGNLLNNLQPSPETIVLLLAFVVGTGTGMGVVTFRYLIDLVHHLFFADLIGVISTTLGKSGSWTLSLMPVFGGVVIGWMRWRWREFGPGLSALVAAVQNAQEVSVVRPVTKMVAAAVSLGSGASLGPEGPSVEIGANLGLLLGQALRVSQERQRLLLGAGAAAGIAAGFNAPIAGVFFALEIVLGTTFATSSASVVVLSAVVSSLVAQIGLGAKPAFELPIYEVLSPLELPLYLGLGLCASLVAIVYTQLNTAAQKAFQGQIPKMAFLTKIPREVQPVLGGLCVGLVALKLPQVLGIGYETIEAVLRDVQFSFPLLMALLVSKLLLTAICLGSGLVGGIFAPALFLGAVLGAAYGELLPKLLPMFASSIATPPAYAMVGMAAVLAASTRAPLTAILLLFELTRDYRIVLPLMAAVGLSVWVVERIRPKKEVVPEPATAEVSTEPAAPDPRQQFLNRLTVKELMQDSLVYLSASSSILDAGLKLIDSKAHSAIVLEAETNAVCGILTLQDINRAIARWEGNLPQDDREPLSQQSIDSICTQKVLYASPDEFVSEALSRMATRGLRQLPVCNPNTPTEILGLLDRDAILNAVSLTQTQEALKPYLIPPVDESLDEPPSQDMLPTEESSSTYLAPSKSR
jgi:H+/Cl- antiporter ClcA/CBS domain-containing protein